MTAPFPLPRRRKAAMIVQALLAQGQKLGLTDWPEESQLSLTRELGQLRIIDRKTLEAVATEFINDLDAVALTAPSSVEGALTALQGQISPGAAARLRDDAVRAHQADPWAQILALASADIAPILQSESLEVAAVVLSKLPVPKAAEVLSLLTGDRARRVTLAMSRTAQIRPDAVSRIGQALAQDHCTQPITAFAIPPDQRVGAILNSAASQTRDQVLGALAEADPAFAEEVRRAIFTFADIPDRLAPLDVPKILRGLDMAGLVTALAAAATEPGPLAEAAEFLLANMSQRMADQLREEMKEKSGIKKSEGETAMAGVVAAIRARADAGEIQLKDAEETV